MVLSFIQYYWQARGAYQIHSPFLFELYNQVLCNRQSHNDFMPIEQLKEDLLKDVRVIDVQDFGAGSQHLKSAQRSLKDIAKYAAISKKQGRLLYRLSQYFQAQHILELGTSLGLSTLYLSKGNTQAKVYTHEGCPNLASLAQEHFQAQGAKNIEVIVGNIDDTLKTSLAQIPQIDLAFLDANHRLQPTLDYFEACLSKVRSQSVLIFDDIHWSTEMEVAWELMYRHPRVSLSLDLYKMGLLFFREKQAKQHFVLRW